MDEDEDEDVVAVAVTIMVVKGISDTIELMVVIIQIPKKGKPDGTTRSGIIPR